MLLKTEDGRTFRAHFEHRAFGGHMGTLLNLHEGPCVLTATRPRKCTLTGRSGAALCSTETLYLATICNLSKKRALKLQVILEEHGFTPRLRRVRDQFSRTTGRATALHRALFEGTPLPRPTRKELWASYIAQGAKIPAARRTK